MNSAKRLTRIYNVLRFVQILIALYLLATMVIAALTSVTLVHSSLVNP